MLDDSELDLGRFERFERYFLGKGGSNSTITFGLDFLFLQEAMATLLVSSALKGNQGIKEGIKVKGKVKCVKVDRKDAE